MMDQRIGNIILTAVVLILLTGVALSPSHAGYESIITRTNPELTEEQVRTYSSALDEADRILPGLSGRLFARAVAEKTGFQYQPSRNGVGLSGLRPGLIRTVDPSLSPEQVSNNPTESILLAARYIKARRAHYGSWTVALSDYLEHDHSAMLRLLEPYHPSPNLISISVDPLSSRSELYRTTIARLQESRTGQASGCRSGNFPVDPDQMARTILRVAGEVDVPADLVFAVAWQETHMRCVTGDIHLAHNSYGIMQVQRRTAQYMLERPVQPENLRTNLEKNLRAGARYLKHWKDRHGNYISAIFNYNGGSMRYLHNVLSRMAWLRGRSKPIHTSLACGTESLSEATRIASRRDP